ncbi:antitoxin Xre/MbcA/ParS toxin-binding domain-containing protein [Sphingomonas sp. IC4-52]|uniref:antitoxin Xre/MbcA/ParS toxin-binding domain-containing protein n=1 Tax=Sphingomonas sp. IC4-52 TaxID=2887202 RepID=UPI001D0FF04F|nr:antitoxin Xre/MbcA/ParS toxin-binding domain-containing protein [Sphingomonas sp. IC4-52]MCC2981165.1 MbcA/ParS/Xre antitoxin family protein [Sphingomonas sp. IC4-52]
MSAAGNDPAAAAATGAAATGRPRRIFRAAKTASRLSGDEVAREGRIVRIAFDRLGAEAARLFLNTPDPALGGRPLALATASPAGADAVERAIEAMPRTSAAQAAREAHEPVSGQ